MRWTARTSWNCANSSTKARWRRAAGTGQLNGETAKLAIAILVGAIVVAGVSYRALRPSNDAPPPSTGTPGMAFFSTDDGKTWFPDSLRKLPPFQKDGKEALRVYVYKGADGKPYVSCLVRYTPQARQELERIYAHGPEMPNPLITNQIEMDGMEVRAPGQSAWLKKSDPRAADLLIPRLPDGSAAQLVLP